MRKEHHIITQMLMSLALAVLWSGGCWALEPGEIVVIANTNVPHSVELAHYYLQKRQIPSENLLSISLTNKEQCSRDEYEKKVLPLVRMYLKEREKGGAGIRCLLLMFGVPLVVLQPEHDVNERAELRRLETQLQSLRMQERLAKTEDEKKSFESSIKELSSKISTFDKSDQSASFDSEIALVLEENYPLRGWIPNQYFIGFRDKKIANLQGKALMVSRLDGPSHETVSRIINDSLAAERNGLKGKAYFDARMPLPASKDLTGYAFYDASIHRAAEQVKNIGLMPVILDEQERLFQPGECPDAALYCGWYSLAKYIPAFSWVAGSIGFHIASAECTTLRQKGSQVWCKAMLENGVAATVGPVGEPYVGAFPVPEVFFKALIDGTLTLAECYAVSNPYWSWKMVLIGDPLYRPFKNRIK